MARIKATRENGFTGKATITEIRGASNRYNDFKWTSPCLCGYKGLYKTCSYWKLSADEEIHEEAKMLGGGYNWQYWGNAMKFGVSYTYKDDNGVEFRVVHTRENRWEAPVSDIERLIEIERGE